MFDLLPILGVEEQHSFVLAQFEARKHFELLCFQVSGLLEASELDVELPGRLEFEFLLLEDDELCADDAQEQHLVLELGVLLRQDLKHARNEDVGRVYIPLAVHEIERDVVIKNELCHGLSFHHLPLKT